MGLINRVFFALLLAVAAFAASFTWKGLVAQPTPAAANLTSSGLTLEKVAEGVYSLIASNDIPPASGDLAFANAGFVIGNEGVLVIDTFQNPKFTELMFNTVKTLTDKPIRYVVNTHYHFDHTGGNAAAAAKNIPIVGRGPIKALMEKFNRQLDPQLTPPNIIVNSETDFWLGNRHVRVERVEGHARGTDVVVYVPEAKVLFTGDMVFNQRIPYVGDGSIRDWQGSLYRLIVTYPDAKIVPGHGSVSDISALRSQLGYLNDLERLALTWKAKGLNKEQAIAMSTTIPDAYKEYKFQDLYAGSPIGLKSNLDAAYDQFSRSSTIPLIP